MTEDDKPTELQLVSHPDDGAGPTHPIFKIKCKVFFEAGKAVPQVHIRNRDKSFDITADISPEITNIMHPKLLKYFWACIDPDGKLRILRSAPRGLF